MNVVIKHENDTALISVIGTVTSTNAGEFESAVKDEPAGMNAMVVDLADLEYISSAGLRVLLALKKRSGKNSFKIVNVIPEVKEVFDVTGFSEIMDISGVRKNVSVDGCELIGAGACGECFRLDDEKIIKLYYAKVSQAEIEQEKAFAKKAFVMGVPTAISYDIVECNGRTGVVYELIKSKTLSELVRSNPEKIEEYADLYADCCKQVHAIKTNDPDIPSFKELNRADIKRLDVINEEEKKYLHRLLDLVPDDNGCIHGDLNMNNIMVQNGECCLIDMGEFSKGIKEFDISRIYFSIVFAAPDGDYNSFYKMPNATVKKMLDLLFERYYGSSDMEQIIKNDPNAKWVEPLAWFRACSSMLRYNKWPEYKIELAKKLFYEKVIPFVDANSK